jgi:hypothetical protein
MYLSVQGSPTGWSTQTGLTPVFRSCSQVASSMGVQASSKAHGGRGTIRTVTAPIRRTSSIFQHHSDPIPATPVAKVAASPSSRIRLPLLPSHPLVLFTVPLSRFHLHIPSTTHLPICHMFKTSISLSYHHRPSWPYRTSRFTIASDFHDYLFLYYALHCILYCI